MTDGLTELRELVARWREMAREIELPVEGIPEFIRLREGGRITSLLHELQPLIDKLEQEIRKACDEATMAEHKSHVDFENELYATLVDPLAEGSIKEAEMRAALLESARWYRQHAHDLENQLNKRLSRQAGERK